MRFRTCTRGTCGVGTSTRCAGLGRRGSVGCCASAHGTGRREGDGAWWSAFAYAWSGSGLLCPRQSIHGGAAPKLEGELTWLLAAVGVLCTVSNNSAETGRERARRLETWPLGETTAASSSPAAAFLRGASRPGESMAALAFVLALAFMEENGPAEPPKRRSGGCWSIVPSAASGSES